MNSGGEARDVIATLQTAIGEFAEERDWQKFHTAKNLSMALAGEVGELLAELQWLEPADVDEALAPGSAGRDRFEDEMADVFIYLLRLADITHVDLTAVATRKLKQNDLRYPVSLARGTATKHKRLAD